MNIKDRQALLDEHVPDRVCPACDKRRPGQPVHGCWAFLTPMQTRIVEQKTGKTLVVICRECYREYFNPSN